MSLIGGNFLNTLLPSLIIIAHISYLLVVLYILMSPYHIGMDRVVIGSIWFSGVFGNG